MDGQNLIMFLIFNVYQNREKHAKKLNKAFTTVGIF